MKSIDERISEIRNDPVKFKRMFNIIWIASYSMLVLGAIIIVIVLLMELI